MPVYDSFFYGALFFLFGVFCASFGFGFTALFITIVIAFIGLSLWFYKRKKYFLVFSFLAVFIPIGAFYYGFFDARSNRIIEQIEFNKKMDISGVVISDPEIVGGSQKAVVETNNPPKLRLLVTFSRMPELSYGNILDLSGVIEKPEPAYYDAYLKKDGVYGVMQFPKFQILESGGGSKIKEFLFGIKNRFIDSFKMVLPQREATFLGGITLGSRGGFSSGFKDAMQLSGTTHLVALSGYNITILAWAVLGVCVYFFRRKISLVITSLIIIGFVLMTGAEASVTRAALMAIIVLLADGIGRPHDVRNVLVATGLFMVLANPRLLTFDIGFQLSFLALLGIIYLKPAISKLFAKFSESPGIFSWRENFLTTLSAQLAVIPLLISKFGVFSLTSFIANILILEFIPITMTLGFLLVFVNLFSYGVSVFVGWITLVPLRFEIGIIELFSKLSVPVTFNISSLFITFYYLFLIGFITSSRFKGYIKK